MGKGRLKKIGGSGGGRIAAPALTDDPGFQLSHPVFCFRYLVAGYSADDCSKEHASAFLKRLTTLSNTDWKTICAMSKERGGFNSLSVAAIKAKLPARVSPDVKDLQVFRFNADGRRPSRIIGWRDGRVFEVYLIDPMGITYEHGGS